MCRSGCHCCSDPGTGPVPLAWLLAHPPLCCGSDPHAPPVQGEEERSHQRKLLLFY